MKRAAKAGGAPIGTKEIEASKPTGKSLGGGYLAFKPADIWYEEPSFVRLSAAFRGDPYGWNPDYTKNEDKSSISGEVYFDIFGGTPILLTDDQVSWNIPGDKEEQPLPIRNSRWMLKKYTTMNFSEILDYLPVYWGQEKNYDDKNRTFLVEIPNARPKRFRVTLPPMDINGKAWSMQPIDFEYHAVGVGVWTYP